MKRKSSGSVGLKRQHPIEDYYSYAEIAVLCRRAVGTIKYLVCIYHIPHIRALGPKREQRIALVPADQVRRLRKLTLGIG